MNRELAINYLQSSGFSDEQIKAIEGAFTCDKCVYSTSECCQYDDITETIPPFETSDDAISRKTVLKIIDGWYEQNRDTDNIEDLIVLITYMDSVNPQKPKSECEHDHEILKAYSDGASAVLDNVRAEIDEQYDRVHPYDILIAEGLERALDIIDKYKAEGSGEE